MSIRLIASGVRDRSVRAWWRLLAMWLVYGCSGVERPSIAIDSVAPDRVSSLVATSVLIRGRHFDDAVAPLDVSSTRAPRIERQWRVSLDDVPGRLSASRLDASTLRFTIPAGLAEGSYGVTVISPSGVEVTRERALTVVDEPVDFALTIETKADGTGEVVSDRALRSGEPLSLYAVVRTSSGEVVSGDYDVAWRATELPDALRETRGLGNVFASERPGSAVVIAENAELGEARTGTLTVRAADASSIAIEDAPGGGGRAVEGRLLTTDDVLKVYAVSRDRFGNFVADVDAEWDVTGGIGEASGMRASSLSLDLMRPGAGVIRAESELGDARTGLLVVRSGRAASLELEPSETTLSADDDPLRFSLSARDRDGNLTFDFGTLSWEVETGAIGALDRASGVLDPRSAGTGVVRATSSHGPVARTGVITIVPGRAARLVASPDTLSLSADDGAATFGATAFDAHDNPTTDTGALTFSVASGPISSLDAVSGKLEPKAAGTGTIRVASAYGPSDETGPITIVPGRAATLSISPKTLTTAIGAEPTTFSARAFDADGNLTLDTGTLSYSLANGTIATLDSVSGKLTPSTAGQDVVRVTSSLGPSADSGAIVVRPLGPIVEITSVTAPAQMSRGQGLARVLVTIDNHSPDQTALLSSVRLSFLRAGVLVDAEYGLFFDSRNSHRLAPSSRTVFVVYVSASGAASSGPITVNAHLDAYVTGVGDVESDATTTFTMLASTAPGAVFTAQDDRVCAGSSITFNGGNSFGFGLDYAWSFEAGTPATSTLETPPAITWSQSGRHLVSLTVTDSTGDQDTAYGSVFVGTTENAASATYPTGLITFAQPSLGGVVDLANLPADDEIAISGSSGTDLRQCNGAVVAASGNGFVTLWSDRGVIDPSQDVRPALPGLQIALANGGTSFDHVEFLPGTPALEGQAMIYAEYYNPALGVVTAAGDQTFFMDNDTQAPSIVAARPANDCANCMGPSWPWVFHFSEPLDPATLSSVAVWSKPGFSCTNSGFINVTAMSSVSYDAPARALYVRPPAAGGNYTLRVLLNGLRDESSNANLLPSLARCVFVSAQPSVEPPAAPSIVGLGPSPFSPDGDGASDTLQFTARVGAAARVVRLAFTRGSSDVRTLLSFVNDAGDVTFSWDGRDYTGRTVPDGIYRYELSVDNAEGESSETISGVVEVDSAVHFAGVGSRY